MKRKSWMHLIVLSSLVILFIGCEEGDETNSTVTDYDGNVYNIVTIGNQVWMAENLKTTHYANGKAITLVEDSTAWDNLSYTDTAMCYYNNSILNKDTYGALYTWTAAMNGAIGSTSNPSGIQGACPDGWHIPSDAEWKELEINLGMSQTDANATDLRGTNEGSKLAGNTHLWADSILVSNSEFGASDFMALPTGYRAGTGMFYGLGTYNYLLSATEYSSMRTWYRGLYYSHSDIFRGGFIKDGALPVRCIKD